MFVPLTFTLAVGENARMRREAESMRTIRVEAAKVSAPAGSAIG